MSDEAQPGRMYSQIFEPHLKETEGEAAYEFNFDTPRYLLFSNNKSNVYGNPRSYRLVLESMSKQVLPDTWPLDEAYAWARYQVSLGYTCGYQS